MKTRTKRRVTQDFSPVDGCATIFNINSITWIKGALIEIIENRGNDHYLIKSLPNGRVLTAKRSDILNKTELVKEEEANEIL